MNRIIVAYARNASREKVCQMLTQAGYAPQSSFRSGAEVIGDIQARGADVVICGCRLSDMTADELADALGSTVPVLVAAAPVCLQQLQRSDHHCLPAPFTAESIAEKLRDLLAAPEAPAKPKRSPEEVALIRCAKELLISRGMTEPEAHTLLQQRSMRERCRLTVTAQRVLEEYAQP